MSEKKEDKKETVKPVRVKLTKEQEAEMFKSLVHKTYKEIGYDMGLHLMYPKSETKMVSKVYSIINKIKKAPELWNISEDVVEVVQEALDSRSIRKNPGLKADIALQEESFRDRLDSMRNTVAEIIEKKLKKYNTHKGIDNVTIRDLKDLLAMAIDKSRLLKGESTENIKRLSPMDVDGMSPEERLQIIMKARDLLLENKK